MLVLVTSWYAAIDSDRTYHMRVTEYNTILPVLKNGLETMLETMLETSFYSCDTAVQYSCTIFFKKIVLLK